MILIGIAGSNGAGKDTIAEELVASHGFCFISTSEALRDEAHTRGQLTERGILSSISAEWRREFGMGILVDKCIEAYNARGGDDEFAGLVVSSIRNDKEAQHLIGLGGHMIWVDADPRLRYNRITQADRGRAAEDNKTFEQFLAEEQAEMVQSGDAATLNTASVRPICEVEISNDGDMESLRLRLEQLTAKLVDS